jgi:hypothetical protein
MRGRRAARVVEDRADARAAALAARRRAAAARRLMAPLTAADLGEPGSGSDDEAAATPLDADTVLQRVCDAFDLEMGYAGAPDAPFDVKPPCLVCTAFDMNQAMWRQAELYPCACCGVQQPYTGVHRVPADAELLHPLRVDGPKSEEVPRHARTTCSLGGVVYCLEPTAVFGECARGQGRTGRWGTSAIQVAQPSSLHPTHTLCAPTVRATQTHQTGRRLLFPRSSYAPSARPWPWTVRWGLATWGV